MSNWQSKIVIAGDGYAPYLAALFISQVAEASSAIVVVAGEDHDNEAIINSAGTLKETLKLLNIAEPAFVKACEAVFNLGTYYTEAGRQRGATPLLVSDADYGLSMARIQFGNLYEAFRRVERDVPFDDFCLSAHLARRERFTPPSNNPRSVFASLRYGYRFASKALGEFLKTQLPARVECLQGRIVDLQRDEYAAISRVVLDSGRTLEGAFFIDATSDRCLINHLASSSSERSAIKELALGVRHRVHKMSDASAAPPYSAIAWGEGVLRHESRLHQSQMVSTIDADAQSSDAGLFYDFKPWRANCLALGPAHCRRLPALVDSVHSLVSQLLLLRDLWPNRPWREHWPQASALFNRSYSEELGQIFDIDNLHLARAFPRRVVLTERNRERVELFQHIGKLPLHEAETLSESQWRALMYAFGYYPQRLDPMAQLLDAQWLVEELKRLRETYAKASAAAPLHKDFCHKIWRA